MPLGLGDLSQMFSARRGQHPRGVGVKDVTAGMDSFMKGFMSGAGEEGGRAEAVCS